MIRGVGLRGATAINVITMIGIGPLITIPLVLAQLHGPYSLVGWLLGAALALCDGLVWAELGSAFPAAGGTYAYLLEIFGREGLGRPLAFLFVWQMIFVVPLTVASGYIGFANYAAYLVPQLAANTLAIKGVAIGIGVITLIALYRGIKATANTSVWLGGVAVITLGSVILGAYAHFSPHLAMAVAPTDSFWSGMRTGLGAALIIAMYDYLGYNQANYVAGEVIEPARTSPRAIVLSIVLVAALYIGMQFGILGALPWQSYVPLGDGSLPPLGQHLASSVVEHSFGVVAAGVVTVLILITAFASVYGNLLGGSRIPYAAATDGNFLKPFAHLHEKHQFPDVALVVLGVFALIACLFTLDQVINALTAGIVLIQSVAQILALFVLRSRGVRAPYRMWLFPVPAIVALAGWLYVFASSGTSAILFGCVSLLAGVLAYGISRAVAR
jgi:amino acid transporter